MPRSSLQARLDDVLDADDAVTEHLRRSSFVMGSLTSKEKAEAAKDVQLRGYAAIGLGSAWDADITSLQNAAALMDQLPVMPFCHAAASANATDAVVGFRQTSDAESLLVHRQAASVERHPSSSSSAGSGGECRAVLSQKRAFTLLEKKLDSAFGFAASTGMDILGNLSTTRGVGARIARISDGCGAGVKPGSGGGPDGTASISSLTVYRTTMDVAEDPKQDISVFTLTLVPAGDTTFQLKDRQTGLMVAPAASLPSSSSSSGSKWALVVYAGMLYDLVCGSGDGQLAPAHCQALSSASASAASSSSASASARSGTVAGVKRARAGAGAEPSAHNSFVFHLIPSATTQLAWGTGGAGSETCKAAIARLASSLPKTIDISVARKGQGADVMAFQLEPESTFESFKQQVATRAGVPVSRVFLFSKGKLLAADDDETIQSLKIRQGASFHLRYGPARFSVTCPDGKVLTLDVDPKKDDVSVLLKAIADAGYGPLDGQYLRFNASGKWLLEGHILDEITNGSRLYLAPAPWTIYIERPGMSPLEMGVHPNDYVIAFLRRVSRAIGVKSRDQFYADTAGGRWLKLLQTFSSCCLSDTGLRNGMHLRLYAGLMSVGFELPAGDVIRLDVRCDATSVDLRKLVTVRTGIAEYDQYLYHNGDSFEHGTAFDFAIADGDTIQVRQGSIKITVEAEEVGCTFDVFADADDVVGVVKRKIQDKCGVQPRHQYLKHGDHWLLNDEQTLDLDDDEIDQQSASLKLLPGPMEVRLNVASRAVLSLRCHPHDTFTHLRTLIKDAIASASLPPICQCIALGTRWLANAKGVSWRLPFRSTVEGAGIVDGSTLLLSDGITALKLQREDGCVFSINVPCTDSFDTLAPKIFEATGVPVHEQYLMLGDYWLHHKESLFSSYVPIGATILIKKGPLPIEVRIAGGPTLALNLHPSEGVDAIHRKVELITGIPADQQSLALPTEAGGPPWRDRHAFDAQLPAMGVKSGCSLPLCHGSISINFKASADAAAVPVTILTSDTVEQVLDKIKAATGVNAESLTMGGHEMMSGRRMAEHGIQPGQAVVLSHGTLHFFVKTRDGKVIPVKTLPMRTIGYLKGIVHQRLGVRPDQQTLLYAGRELRNDARTLRYCNIRNDSNVHLVLAVRGR